MGTNSGHLKKLKALAVPLYFAVLALVVWGKAIFDYGFVLLGDMVFTPVMNPGASIFGPPRGLMSVTVIFNLVHLLSRAISGMATQKIIMFLIVFLPGIAMYCSVPCKTRWGKLFAGTLYLVNPFIYVRLIMGHWCFILGYALLPLVARSALKTVDEPGAGNAAACGLWIGLTAFISAHCGVMAIITVALIWLCALFERGNTRKIVISFGVTVMVFVLVSACWLLPALQFEGLESRIDRDDLEAFQTQSTSQAGVGVSVLGMYGYWKSGLDPVLPRSNLPLWPVFTLLFVVLSVAGAAFYWKEERARVLVRALCIVAVLGFFLALGSRAPVTGGLFKFLFDHFSVFKLFREPQKFVALLSLSYAMLGALGFERLFLLGKRERRRDVLVHAGAYVLIILAVFSYSYRMLGGLWGEAKAVSYPESWSQARKLMNNDKDDFKILYLPPYWYMSFGFTGGDRSIASPLPYYFDQRSIPLFRIDVGRFKLNEQDTDRYVRSALDSAESQGNLGALLAPLNVKYVLFARSEGSGYLEYVLEQDDMEIVKQWPDLVLLKNKQDAPRLSLAEGEGTYSSWEEVGKIASGEILTGSHITRGSRTEIPDRPGLPIEYRLTGANRVEFNLSGVRNNGGRASNNHFVLLGEPYNRGWLMDGKAATGQLGISCAFPIGKDVSARHELKYKNDLLLAGYVISLVSLLVSIALVVLDVRKEGTGKNEAKEAS